MPDPAPETDRELLYRLLPGWGLVRRDFNCVRVESDGFIGCTSDSTHTAIGAAAGALRAILARDRETRGEATKPVTPPLRRWPVQIVPYTLGEDTCFLAIANDGTLWETGCPIAGKWLRGITLPQPGEDGGE